MDIKSGKTHVAESSSQCTNRTVDGDLEFLAKSLRTLAEIDKSPPAVVQPTRMSELRHNLYAGMATLLYLYVGYCMYDRWLGVLPTKVTSVQVLSEFPVQLGDKLRVRFELTRYKTCQRSFWWIMQDHSGNRRRFIEPPMDGIGHPGPDAFNQDFPVPTDLDPGPAKLRIVWSWSCPENLLEAVYPVVLVLKDVPFEIAPKL